MPRAGGRLRRWQPALDLVLGVAETADAVHALRFGAVDPAVVIEPDPVDGAPEDDLHRVHLLDDPYSVLLPAGQPLAAGLDVALADRATETGWPPSRRPATAGRRDTCEAAGFTPAPPRRPTGTPRTQGFVAAGLGVALVPALTLGLVHGGVVVRPVRGPRPVRRVDVVVRRARAGEQLVQVAVQALCAADAVPAVLGRVRASCVGYRSCTTTRGSLP